MATNADKIQVLNNEKTINLATIVNLQNTVITLNNQINDNLLLNADFEVQKTNCNNEITSLENQNNVIDAMIADYS